MIRDIEIKEMAREYGVPETTIEKDYALNWILRSLYQQTDSFALKGGTGLRKIYFEFKKISPEINDVLDRKQDFQNAWNSSLGHQLKGLPDFDMIFNEVTDILASIINKQKTPPSAAPHRGLGSQPQRRDDKKTKSKKHRASKDQKI